MTLSIIGQAFVAVRPDLKGFASDLQTKVNALSPVKIKVGITKVSAKAAVDYAFAGMTVSVKLKVKTPSAAEISRQIGTVVLKTTLSPPTGAGRGQALSPAGGETKKAAVVGGKTPKLTGAPAPMEVVPTLSANARALLTEQIAAAGGAIPFPATPDLVANAQKLLATQLVAQGAVPFSAIPVIDKQSAAALATQAAALPPVQVKTVTVTGKAVESATRRVSQVAAAAAPIDVSLAVLKVQQDLKIATGELAQANQILAEAQKAAALSARELETAQASQNKNFKRRAEGTDVEARKALSDAKELQASSQIRSDTNKVAAVNAEKLASAQSIANQSLRQTQAVTVNAANAEDLLRKNRVATNAVAAKYQQAITAENFGLAEQIELQRQLLVAEGARIQGRVALTAATGLAASVGLEAGATPIATAEIAHKDAVAADTAAIKARELALASTNELLITQSSVLAQNTAQERLRTAGVLASLEAGKARQPIDAAFSRIAGAQALANDTSLTTAARVTQAARAHTLAAAAAEKFSAATSVATAAEIKHFQQLEIDTAALLANAKAQNVAAIASARTTRSIATETAARSTLTSQAVRGTAATGATFLGLRGAVLSASTGFLAATVFLTGLSKIVKTAEDLTRQLNIFQSVSNATGGQMAAVSAKARQLGADLSLPATSATDAAEAMTELQKAGLSVNNTLGAAKGVLQLSAAAGLSNIDAAKIVATQLNAFGLAGEEAGRIVDLLAGASIAAQGEISDFALAFQQVAAVAHQVGLPVETATAILTQFAQSGIRGSDAGTSLRTMLLRLVPTTKAAEEAQAELGITLDRSIPIGEQFTNLVDQYTASLAKLGPVAQQESLTKIFGQDAIRGASVSLTSGSEALVRLQASVSQAGSAARLTEGRVKGLSGSVEGLKSNVSTLAATIGQTMLPTLDSLAHTFSSIATQANAVAGALSAIGNVTIKPIGNLLGGTDALAQGAVALAAVLGARKLIQGRADKKAAAAINQSILEIQLRMTKLGVSEEEVSRLFGLMGITAEEANLRAARAQATLNKEIAVTNEQLIAGRILVEEDLAARSAQISTPAKTGITAALAEQAIIQERILATHGKIGIAAAESGAIQVEANAKVLASADPVLKTNELIAASSGLRAKAAAGAAAVEVAANRSVIGASLLGRGKGIAGKFGGRGISGKGLGIGIAATIAGEAIGGEAGGVLSAAGTGATFGSFLGPEGAVVGAAAFGAFELLNQSKKASKERQEKLKAAFQAMTPQEQRDYIALLFPNKANKNIQNDVLSLLARTKTLPLTGEVVKARDTIEKLGGLNQEDKAALAALRARNQARRKLAAEATKGVIPLPGLADFASPPIPSGGPFPGVVARLRQAQFAAGGVFGPKFGPIPAPRKVKVSPPKIEVDRRVIAANKQALAELKEAQTGDTSGLEAIAAADVADKQSLVNRLKSRIANLKVPVGGPTLENALAFIKAQSELTTKMTAAAKVLAEKINDLNSIQIAAINTESFSVQIGALKAEGTKTLVDDLANARKAQAEAGKKPATSTVAQQEKAKAVQAAKNKVGGIEDQIAADTKAAAEKAKSDAEKARDEAAKAAQIRIDTLRRIADNAGNVGKAEDALIAALKQQVVKAKGNAADLNTALAALDAERKNQAAAIAASQQLTFDLFQSVIDRKRAAAELTDTPADNKVADSLVIKLLNREIIAAKAAAEKAKGSIVEWKQARIKVNQAIAARDNFLKSLKDNQEAGGFSLEDLFKEASSQFNQFASNVSTQITTPGGVRGAVAGGIRAQNPGLSQADRDKLRVASTTNDLLADILLAVKGPGDPSSSAPAVDPRFNVPSGWYVPGAATASSAKRFARHK